MASRPVHTILSLACNLVALTYLTAQDPTIPADTEIKTTASGLKYSVLKEGDGGARPSGADMVKVHYSGWLTDGTLFDSSRQRGTPMELRVNGVIKGWTEGLQLMSVGARYKFTIPYELAYGEQAQGKIPARSTLIFDVELLSFTATPTFPEARPELQRKTKSGLIYQVMTQGKGKRPEGDDNYELDFAMFHPDGTLLDGTFRSKVKLGKQHAEQMTFIAETVAMMKVGSVMRVEVPAAQVWPRGIPSGLPELGEDGMLIWQLELKRVIKALPLPGFALPADSELTTTPSGLMYLVIKEGTGKKPNAAQRVTVHYAGWLTDGTLFDASYPRGDTTSFALLGVIPGWTEGLQLMKEGAIYKFVIPGNLAYGSRGQGKVIGPNATLVFQIELIKVGG